MLQEQKRLITIAARAALAGLLLAAAPAAPAFAGGMFGLNVAPRTAEDAALMDFGLRAYGLYKGLKGGGARIDQRGHGNSAGIAQDGSGTIGIIDQRGDGHSATLDQSGDGNSYGIFQFGRGSAADIVQRGHGRTGATVTFGW